MVKSLKSREFPALPSCLRTHPHAALKMTDLTENDQLEVDYDSSYESDVQS